jgi:hypothetical protein
MKNIFSRLFTRFFLISFSFIAPVVNAALPVQMDGKELPSLAPML